MKRGWNQNGKSSSIISSKHKLIDKHSFIIPIYLSQTSLSSSPVHEEVNEIPIWICGEPRFVSGITSQTTCSNIIEALIEDELQAMDGNVRGES